MKRSSLIYQSIRRTSFQDIPDEQMIIQILMKRGKEKSAKDLLIICNYLENTEMIKNFQKEKIEEKAIRKMIIFCSSILEYQFVEKGEFVFKQGDPSDKLYIIIKGIVSISRLREINSTYRMNGEEYFKYLIDLKNKREDENMRMTIKANIKKFDVDINDSEYFSEILFKIKLRKFASKKNVIEIIGLFKEYDRNPKDFEIDFNGVKTQENHFNFSLIRKRTIIETSKYNIRKYLFLENKQDFKSIILYRNEVFAHLKDGDYFGDMQIETNPVRGITVEAKENCHLGFIYQKYYKENIFNEKKKIIQKECVFFIDNFFRAININTFMNKYYYYFMEEGYSKGNIIVQENEKIDYIYFIKEGEVELTVNMNILELTEKIEYLSKKLDLNIKYPSLSQEIKEIWKKNHMKLVIIASKQVILLKNYFYNIQPFFTCKVIIDSTKIYKIRTDDFSKIIKDEVDCRKIFHKKAKEKLKIILDRLIEFRNIFLKEIEGKQFKVVLEDDIKKREKIIDNFKIQFISNNSDSLNPKSSFSSKLRHLFLTDKIENASRNGNFLSFNNLNSKNKMYDPFSSCSNFLPKKKLISIRNEITPSKKFEFQKKKNMYSYFTNLSRSIIPNPQPLAFKIIKNNNSNNQITRDLGNNIKHIFLKSNNYSSSDTQAIPYTSRFTNSCDKETDTFLDTFSNGEYPEIAVKSFPSFPCKTPMNLLYISQRIQRIKKNKECYYNKFCQK